MSVRVIQGDCIEVLRTLPAESVHMCLTSPPYWGLRCYGVEGQFGLEPTLGEHLEKMVEVFAEVHRVLRKDGVCFVNYGDCYATSVQGHKPGEDGRIRTGKDDRTFTPKPFSTVGPINRGKRQERGAGRWGGGNNSSPGLKAKDLCMVSNRLAIALQEWGWWVRSEIIWAKPNPMPESVSDRPTQSHEKVWLLTKSARYFWDAEAVREQHEPSSLARAKRSWKPSERNSENKPPGESERWRVKELAYNPSGRNLRNVWTIATHAYPDAHFATFPPKLAETCIKAGCPKDGTVLDPFGGSGTTGLVADRLQRDAILIDLNTEYCEMGMARIKKDAPLFADVEGPAP